MAVCLALTTWALVERLSAVQARAERDLAQLKLAVVVADANACKASVSRDREIGEAAIAATAELVSVAKRLKAPAVHTVERIETVLERPTPPGAGCDQAWDTIEQVHKAGAAQ